MLLSSQSFSLSHALRGVEANYLPLKKAIFALVTTAQHLKPYFQTHPIIVRSNLPLQDIMQQSDHSGRMTKWYIELTAFDICYEPRRAINAQASAEFVAELIIRPPKEGPTRIPPMKPGLLE